MNGNFNWSKTLTMSLDVSVEELCQMWWALNDYNAYYATWNTIDEMLEEVLQMDDYRNGHDTTYSFVRATLGINDDN